MSKDNERLWRVTMFNFPAESELATGLEECRKRFNFVRLSVCY